MLGSDPCNTCTEMATKLHRIVRSSNRFGKGLKLVFGITFMGYLFILVRFSLTIEQIDQGPVAPRTTLNHHSSLRSTRAQITNVPTSTTRPTVSILVFNQTREDIDLPMNPPLVLSLIHDIKKNKSVNFRCTEAKVPGVPDTWWIKSRTQLRRTFTVPICHFNPKEDKLISGSISEGVVYEANLVLNMMSVLKVIRNVGFVDIGANLGV